MKRFFYLFLAISMSFSAFSQKKEIKLSKYTFGEYKAREIGPAVMSGRISAIDALESNHNIIYVGAASGGVWKSTNGGTSFKSIFDKHIQSIGCITIDQKNPETIWVGTGEVWVRNSTSVGDGIYKSTDGGEKWKNLGLKDTERIGQIQIDPEDGNIVYAAALGPLWRADSARGVYKTNDGGKTWNQVLFVDENTGCSSLIIDPLDSKHLIAGMWNFRRTAYFFHSGGESSGVFESFDGGESWKKISKGLPEGKLGRIALEVSPAYPQRIYGLVESKKSALYRSDDSGKSWKMVNSNSQMGERPFYFQYMKADPVDSARIYKPGFSMVVSDNAGENFESPFVGGGNVHSDIHALWISPQDNRILYLGSDGGMYISVDKGNTWRMVRNLPLSQFYHVSVDNDIPYHVYGGLQDNGSWYAPSKSPGGISNKDWQFLGYGDGFNVFRDQVDPNLVYWQYQGGNYSKKYLNSGEQKTIKPQAEEGQEELRFNWNAPMSFSPDGKRMYVGSQYLHLSTDQGESWTSISPDLSTNDPKKLQQEETGGLTVDNSSAENHCTLFCITESPLDKNEIWVGSDDGQLQLTRDAGKTWENLSNNIAELPKHTWVSHVEASSHFPGTAYATFDGHKSGDSKAYVFKTTDYGKSWTSLITNDLPIYCHIIKEDFSNPNLLFLGTEFGMYISIDAGKQWVPFNGGIPKASVRDMVFQKRENDLVIATHGRGIFIIDDLTPLQSMKKEKLNEDLVFLDSRPTLISYLGWSIDQQGDNDYSASNPSSSPMITYYLKKRHMFGDMYMEIFDENGELLSELAAGKGKGINRVPWNMRMKAPKVPKSSQMLNAAFVGPSYPPGTYHVKLYKKDKIYEHQFEIKYDPNSNHSPADRDLRYKTLIEAYDLLEDLAFMDHHILEIRDQAAINQSESQGKLKEELTELEKEMDSWHQSISATKYGRITGEVRLRDRIADIYSGVMSFQGKPSATQISRLADLKMDIQIMQEELEDYENNELNKLNKKLKKKNLSIITLSSRTDFDNKK
ncbi:MULTISPECIES: glycosyl hydrolase [unclassified Lentimicrobium]|uniref:WD40/YVTN/BNR-like repeat-containing protein n=1 Tax=unclassified Lentimicrobium TaxID=2677434 RepID=UPI0015542DAA|nr:MULTISPECIES: glycosyl hydrolase [unclassified Lentimicrobium]NPD45030.1 glycosyl hydrolase [Lentimicrobium sp. S6]NPD86052.1 glycosyl hydrolase [Lentimicrobium sp. L6]